MNLTVAGEGVAAVLRHGYRSAVVHGGPRVLRPGPAGSDGRTVDGGSGQALLPMTEHLGEDPAHGADLPSGATSISTL
jgi:hypothetical protein